jgi:hypothetical protein
VKNTVLEPIIGNRWSGKMKFLDNILAYAFGNIDPKKAVECPGESGVCPV